MGIGAAIAGGTALAGVAGSAISSGAASKASKTAANTAAANNALQSQIYGENKQALSPYESAGNEATEQLRRLLGLGDSNTGKSVNGVSYTADQQQQGAISAFQQSAPYQAEEKAGEQAVTASLGSKGLLDSGAALKSLQSYGDQFLSSKLGTYESQLSALGGQGLTAAGAQAGVGTGYANASNANSNAAATASENAALSSASSENAALSGLTSSAGLYAGLSSSYGSSALGGSNNAYGISGSDGIY